MNVERHIFSYSCGEETVCVSTTAISLPDILLKVTDYLRACGYVIPDDRVLDVVPRDRDQSCEAPDDLDPTEDGKEGV